MGQIQFIAKHRRVARFDSLPDVMPEYRLQARRSMLADRWDKTAPDEPPPQVVDGEPESPILPRLQETEEL